MSNAGEMFLRAKARRSDEEVQAANLKKSIAAMGQMMKGPING